MYSKIIINILLIFILVGVQFSFISSLPGRLGNFNLILVSLIFILGLINLKFALWWAVGAGLLQDILFFSYFGVFLISLSVAVLIINLLQTNFFTNRSFYSFIALTFFFTIIYDFIFNIINYFMGLFGPEAILFILRREYWINLLDQIILNLLAVFIIFYTINFISNRLKPAFLVKTKN